MAEGTGTGSSYKSKIDDILNHTFVGMGVALAYQVGIIPALTQSDVAMTSQEVADAKGLKERYVRELLNCLACAHIVEAERVDGTLRFNIPKENKSVFDPSVTPFLQLMASCAVRFQGLTDCAAKDGPYGLPYGDYAITLEAIDRLSRARIDTEIKLLTENIPGIKAKLDAGIRVIELGSGTASFISEMAQRFPKSDFIGSDYNVKTLETAKKSTAPLGLENLKLIQIDIFDIPKDHVAKYDLVIVNDVIHDLPDPEGGLRGLRQVLKPGGHVANYEIGTENDLMVGKDLPVMGVAYCLSTYHCVPQAYHTVDSSPLGCCWGKDTAIRYSERAGLKVVSQHPYFDMFVLYVCEAI